MNLAELVSEKRDEIVAAFVRRARSKDLVPANLSRSAVVDHIPLLLTQLARELQQVDDGRGSEDAAEVEATAREHGEQRWHLGYELSGVVREYGVLTRCILDAAKAANVTPTVDEVTLLCRCINLAVADATTEYARWTEEQQTARHLEVEFLSEAAALLTSSLDYQSTLGRLTRLLVPRFADYCIVNLRGVPPAEVAVAHVEPEKVSLLREMLRGFDPTQGPPTHAHVFDTGEPILVESPPPGFPDSYAASPRIVAALRELNASSWMVLPLKVQGGGLGTMTLARCGSRQPYGRTDLLIFAELARTAASAIDNARLYEMSRAERARAEAATRAKDEFVAMVSHELRTPLNVIMGWVRLLRSGVLPESTKEKALDVIERNSSAQSQLVDDLLDISRVMTGKIRLDPAQVDLGHLVNLVLEDARFVLEAKSLELETVLPNGGAIMRGDAERLKQIVWNLLLNAIKFTPKGGRIRVEVGSLESDLELRVRDTGIGIAHEFLPHVFDTFRQSDSKSTRRHGGLGVGLSIVKHLVELHGGSIEARSAGPGNGAEFVVRLPVSPLISTTLGVAKVPATMPPRKALSRPEVLAGLSVLIVDDEEDARDLLRIVVESCDARAHVAASVPQALATLASEHVDVIVSDIGMPEQDGYDLIRAVRALPDATKASLPAIALTAFARGDDRSQALLAGFNAHMTKPVELADLLAALADLVTHAKSNPDPADDESASSGD
jgi:signal transduction histidine kinase/ActR/RegA family two-component response regulator